MNATPLVELRHLKQYFEVKTGPFRRQPLKAVDDVSLTIHRGETLGLVGESGCGKSTLGRTLLHLYPPTGGQVLFDGQPVNGRQKVFRRRTAMVFQDPYSSLNPRMTVADLIAEPLDIHRLCPTRAQRTQRVLTLMERVGLHPEQAGRYAHEFSGGQRQRIGIARALATEPDFVVCDEPVSALDVSIQAQVVNMFRQLQEECHLTYLFVAHDLPVVRHISDRIAVMYLGRVVELGPADAVYDHPLHPYTRILMDAVPVPDPHRQKAPHIPLAGDIPSPLNTPSGCPFRTRCPYAQNRCAESIPPLSQWASGRFAACHRIGEID
ncbi:MAG: ATP-binding cassette domain-containing protein [Ruminococcaceae bacterium]|nr:ATP-binding cassette domain-containing protein [Oscillospiraceae bacterium]